MIPFPPGSATTVTATYYAEATDEGIAVLNVALINMDDPINSFAADNAAIDARKNKPVTVEKIQTKTIAKTAVNSILNNGALTNEQRRDAILELVLDEFNSDSEFSEGAIAGVNGPVDPLPDEGIVTSPLTIGAVAQLKAGVLAGYSGWVMGWKIGGTATREFAYDLSNSKIRWMTWYLTTTGDSQLSYPVILKVNGTQVITAVSPLTLGQHEHMHTDGVKFNNWHQNVLNAGLTFYNEDDPPTNTSGKVPLKRGYKFAFQRRRGHLNTAVANLRISDGLTDDDVRAKARELITLTLISQTSSISSTGFWHGGLVKLLADGKRYYTYAGVTVPAALIDNS